MELTMNSDLRYEETIPDWSNSPIQLSYLPTSDIYQSERCITLSLSQEIHNESHNDMFWSGVIKGEPYSSALGFIPVSAYINQGTAEFENLERTYFDEETKSEKKYHMKLDETGQFIFRLNNCQHTFYLPRQEFCFSLM